MGIGDLGREAFRFVDFLARSGQSVWQILPLGPTGYGHSPYNTLSAFAGNPALIDLQQLVDCGDLERAELEAAIKDNAAADFDQAHSVKNSLLQQAGQRFLTGPPSSRRTAFADFCREQAGWLEDFSLFMALRDQHAGRSWSEWPVELRNRESQALQEWRGRLEPACSLQRYQQFVFHGQWQELKDYADQNGIRLFGDIPIFVAYDSADVWANQSLFQLDETGRMTAVAGVPPDYFSATGQRWGNPLYRWDRLAGQEFAWWLQRFDHQLHFSDLIRIDHFRGFQACWSIPADEKTAVKGHWVDVPGHRLFEKLRETRGTLPIVAEDLGVITPEVEQLRDDFGFPGMKLLQFAFDSGPDNPYLPGNHTQNSVVYTGTHDNDTTLGWWQKLDREQKDRVRGYLGKQSLDMPWDLIDTAMASEACLCIIPCQDILALDSQARFNTPGKATGNWRWRLLPDMLSDELAKRLLETAQRHQRTIQ